MNDPIPEHQSMRQELQNAFLRGEGYNLTGPELEVIYLALIRLHELEQFGHARDWEAVAAYCPNPDEDEDLIAKTLHLVLTFHWFDETDQGTKRVEYRAINDRWTKLIWDARDRFAFVRFARGYTARTNTYRVTNIDIGPCPIPGWEGDFYRIHFTDLPTPCPKT